MKLKYVYVSTNYILFKNYHNILTSIAFIFSKPINNDK